MSALNHNKFCFIQPKNIHYHCDGTGRDYVIGHFNGGLVNPDMTKKLQPLIHNSFIPLHFERNAQQKRRNPPAFENKVTHYMSDGSGRDSYVTVNEGGRVQTWNGKDRGDALFFGNLRSYQKLPSIQDTGCFAYTSPKEQAIKRYRNSKQRQDANRMSQPRFIKSSVDLGTLKQSYVRTEQY